MLKVLGGVTPPTPPSFAPLAGRMKNKLYEEIADEQYGFRTRKGTRNQIPSLKLIMEKHREWCYNLYMCLIKYQKVFDTVDHKALRKTLLEMGFPQHLIHLINELHSNQKATVRTAYGLTDFFALVKESDKAASYHRIFFTSTQGKL